MNLKNTLIRGTILLTIAGLTSRIMGFFYKIFLANTIGAEGLGIYQLIFPIYSICFSFCASGIETAVSKLTAEKCALGRPKDAIKILRTCLLITLTLSLGCSTLIFCHADWIALKFLKETRCENLLKILALTIPFGTTQSCICGYYFGIHKAVVPAFSQLIEQSFRIAAVWLLYHIYITNHLAISPTIAVMGLVFGELCSFLFTLTCYSFSQKEKVLFRDSYAISNLKEILILSTPLTVSRLCINLLASLEAAMLPTALKAYGMNSQTALSIYGILTGMALPFILFPNALTGSISLMLLPKVSESQAQGQTTALKNILNHTFRFCLLLGFFCLLFFITFGDFLGNFVFSNELAGNFIQTLAWICPFLYLNTTLNSVLNGLGKTSVTFFNGISGLFIRIGFILIGVPKLGIQGYLLSLLTSQLFVTLSSMIFLRHSLTIAK